MNAENGHRRRRLETLRGLMESRGLGAVLLKRPANFAWYTGGADNRVDRGDELGVAGVVVTREGECVLTDNIESARMREEQTPGIEVVEHPWHDGEDSTLRELARGEPLGADFAMEGAEDVSGPLSEMRHVLDEAAIERYREVGADAARALGEAANVVEPSMGEREAAAALAAACLRRGLHAPVLLAAGEARISRYRHPIPAGGPLGRRAMLVVCAERGGLYANLTRFVHFEEPDGELRRCLDSCGEISRRMREEATRPGRTLAEAFADCRRFYAEAGYPEEWRLHHQGGLTGYASREVVATDETTLEIRVGNAFAWNPSITGAKAEETFVLTERGPEVLTDPARASGEHHGPARRPTRREEESRGSSE